MNLLEVKNICKTYGSGETTVKALKDVSFSVPKGEYVAIVGESGSGKSTLLNMIGALDTPTSGKVLIDGKDIFAVDMLKSYFEMQSFVVYTAYDGETALKQAACHPDLVLLDINMPGMDGLTVCEKIRSHISCPILFLTARIETADKIKGFQVGADDYIIKPFDIDELGARVAAHLRRENRKQGQSELRFFSEMVIDYSKREVSINGTPVNLSKKEFDIVELLSLNAGQVFDRERIYEAVWGLDGEGNSDTIMEHIRKIRNKFAALSRHSYIETVWGVGYKWNG